MTTKYFDETVEVAVDLDEWSTEELIDELVDRGQEAIDDLMARFGSLSDTDERLIKNLFIAYIAKDVELFNRELKDLFKEVLGQRI
jgi:hypothetical protein